MISVDFRVYYEDTDAAGIVYYANYLKFAERARTEMLRCMGMEQSALKERLGIAFVVRHMEVDFLRPGRLDDLLTIETHLVDMGAAHFCMRQRISCKDVTLVNLSIKLAVIGKNMQVARVPACVRKAFEALSTKP